MHIGEMTNYQAESKKYATGNTQPSTLTVLLALQELGESTGQLKVLLGKVQTQLLQMKSEGQIVKRVRRAKASGIKAKQTLMICANTMRILDYFSRIGGKLNLMMRLKALVPAVTRSKTNLNLQVGIPAV